MINFVGKNLTHHEDDDKPFYQDDRYYYNAYYGIDSADDVPELIQFDSETGTISPISPLPYCPGENSTVNLRPHYAVVYASDTGHPAAGDARRLCGPGDAVCVPTHEERPIRAACQLDIWRSPGGHARLQGRRLCVDAVQPQPDQVPDSGVHALVSVFPAEGKLVDASVMHFEVLACVS